MQVKLTHDEINLLINALQYSNDCRFLTYYESKLSGAILKDFLSTLIKRSIDLRASSFKLQNHTVLVLDQVLKQIHTECAYTNALIAQLHEKINIACLSI